MIDVQIINIFNNEEDESNINFKERNTPCIVGYVRSYANIM